jgi:hypothetical protein
VDAAPDDDVGTGDVVVTFDPSAKVSDVVVEPSLLVADVVDAPCNACSNGSEFDAPAPLSPEPPDWT